MDQTSELRRSGRDREISRMRERRRRAITRNIIKGLRENGGYNLSNRADINQVLSELAKEAGWVVEPDGTTYRTQGFNMCPTCGYDLRNNPMNSIPIAARATTTNVVMGVTGNNSVASFPRGGINSGDSITMTQFDHQIGSSFQPNSNLIYNCQGQGHLNFGGNNGDGFVGCSNMPMTEYVHQQGVTLSSQKDANNTSNQVATPAGPPPLPHY